jgi:hypothetical protein
MWDVSQGESPIVGSAQLWRMYVMLPAPVGQFRVHHGLTSVPDKYQLVGLIYLFMASST